MGDRIHLDNRAIAVITALFGGLATLVIGEFIAFQLVNNEIARGMKWRLLKTRAIIVAVILAAACFLPPFIDHRPIIRLSLFLFGSAACACAFSATIEVQQRRINRSQRALDTTKSVKNDE